MSSPMIASSSSSGSLVTSTNSKKDEFEYVSFPRDEPHSRSQAHKPSPPIPALRRTRNTNLERNSFRMVKEKIVPFVTVAEEDGPQEYHLTQPTDTLATHLSSGLSSVISLPQEDGSSERSFGRHPKPTFVTTREEMLEDTSFYPEPELADPGSSVRGLLQVHLSQQTETILRLIRQELVKFNSPLYVLPEATPPSARQTLPKDKSKS